MPPQSRTSCAANCNPSFHQVILAAHHVLGHKKVVSLLDRKCSAIAFCKFVRGAGKQCGSTLQPKIPGRSGFSSAISVHSCHAEFGFYKVGQLHGFSIAKFS